MSVSFYPSAWHTVSWQPMLIGSLKEAVTQRRHWLTLSGMNQRGLSGLKEEQKFAGCSRQWGQKVQRPRVVALGGMMVVLRCRERAAGAGCALGRPSRCVQKLGEGIRRGTMALLCRQC